MPRTLPKPRRREQLSVARASDYLPVRFSTLPPQVVAYASSSMVGETTPPRQPVAGDIVVTKVAAHYQVSRVILEGRPWAALETIDSLADALALACGLAREPQRVFLNARGSKSGHVLIDCANPYWKDR